jgi:hypothetical protein
MPDGGTENELAFVSKHPRKTRISLVVEALNRNTPNERKVPLEIWECKRKINKSLQLFLAGI